MCGKGFLIYCGHIPRTSINLCFFTLAPVLHSKVLAEFFENLFPPRQNGWAGGSYDLLYQYSSRKYENDLEH